MENITIRTMVPEEYPLLKKFTYLAIFQRDTRKMLPEEVVEEPQLAVYYREFGRPHDLALVAECGGKIVGTVWVRILCGEGKGFGNVDSHTPEFAISLFPEFRGRGIGTRLMSAMLDRLKFKGYLRASLAVQKDNYALKMYLAAGFCIVKETEEEYLMLAKLR